LWTEAIYDLRLTEEQFWSMTPRQLVWLRDRHKQEREYQELLMAIPTATLANHSFNPPKKPYKPFDFMPSQVRAKAEKEPKKRWTRKGFASQLSAMRGAMPNHFIIKPAPAKPE
jgi:hypothetical protein